MGDRRNGGPGPARSSRWLLSHRSLLGVQGAQSPPWCTGRVVRRAAARSTAFVFAIVSDALAIVRESAACDPAMHCLCSQACRKCSLFLACCAQRGACIRCTLYTAVVMYTVYSVYTNCRIGCIRCSAVYLDTVRGGTCGGCIPFLQQKYSTIHQESCCIREKMM